MAVVAAVQTDDGLQAWLTRNEAQDLLGCGVHKLLDLERQGVLKPRQIVDRSRAGRRGSAIITVYNPRELLNVPRRETKVRRTPGELAALAFELFDEGVSLREAVIRLREPLATLEELHQQWLDAGGAQLVLTAAARAELARYIGDVDHVADLCERVGLLARMLRESEERGRELSRAPARDTTTTADRVPLEVLAPIDITDRELEAAIVRALDREGG